MRFLSLWIMVAFCQVNEDDDDFFDIIFGDNSKSKKQEHSQEDSNWIPLFSFITFFALIVWQLRSKSKTKETVKQKMTKFLAGKGMKTEDIVNRLNSVMALFETHKFQLRFKQFDKWFTKETINISINLNIDVISININGNDTNGKWQLNGSILVNKYDQLVCLLDKFYEKTSLQKNDQLYYEGVYNARVLKFEGDWYYEKSGIQGIWEGQFK